MLTTGESYACYYCCVTQADTVIPDATGLVLPGQMNIPGGSASNGTLQYGDASGNNAIYQDASVNPNPTGGWMPLAQSLINTAQKSYLAFEKGSPAPATPTARQAKQVQAGTSGISLTNQGFSFNLPFSGQTLLLLGLGVVALIVIAN